MDAVSYTHLDVYKRQEANRAVASETELRLQQMRAGIMEVKAPGFDRPTESVPAPSAAAGASPLEYAAVSDEAPAAPYGEALAGQTCAMPPLNVDDLRVENFFAQPPTGDVYKRQGICSPRTRLSFEGLLNLLQCYV